MSRSTTKSSGVLFMCFRWNSRLKAGLFMINQLTYVNVQGSSNQASLGISSEVKKTFYRLSISGKKASSLKKTTEQISSI